MEEYQEYEPKKSKYNSAIALLYRLDSLWKQANYSATTNQLIRWNLVLDAVWREIAEDSNVKEKEEKKFSSFNKDLVKAKFFETNEKPQGFEDKKPKDKEKEAVHYQILNNKEIWLRKLQHKLGKGTVYEDTIDDYLDS